MQKLVGLSLATAVLLVHIGTTAHGSGQCADGKDRTVDHDENVNTRLRACLGFNTLKQVFKTEIQQPCVALQI